jgi:hypothetical protein
VDDDGEWHPSLPAAVGKLRFLPLVSHSTYWIQSTIHSQRIQFLANHVTRFGLARGVSPFSRRSSFIRRVSAGQPRVGMPKEDISRCETQDLLTASRIQRKAHTLPVDTVDDSFSVEKKSLI